MSCSGSCMVASIVSEMMVQQIQVGLKTLLIVFTVKLSSQNYARVCSQDKNKKSGKKSDSISSAFCWGCPGEPAVVRTFSIARNCASVPLTSTYCIIKCFQFPLFFSSLQFFGQHGWDVIDAPNCELWSVFTQDLTSPVSQFQDTEIDTLLLLCTAVHFMHFVHNCWHGQPVWQ